MIVIMIGYCWPSHLFSSVSCLWWCWSIHPTIRDNRRCVSLYSHLPLAFRLSYILPVLLFLRIRFIIGSVFWPQDRQDDMCQQSGKWLISFYLYIYIYLLSSRSSYVSSIPSLSRTWCHEFISMDTHTYTSNTILSFLSFFSSLFYFFYLASPTTIPQQQQQQQHCSTTTKTKHVGGWEIERDVRSKSKLVIPFATRVHDSGPDCHSGCGRGRRCHLWWLFIPVRVRISK